jgi:hypothetical protein
MKKEIRTLFAIPVFALFMQATFAYAVSPEAINITTSTAQIRWQNELLSSYSYVTYGTVSGQAQYPNTRTQPCQIPGTVSGGYAATTTPCIQLSDLLPATTYYFKTVSIPQNNNGGTLVVNNGIITSNESHFTTSALATQPTPTPTVITPITPSSPINFIAKSSQENPYNVMLSWSNQSTNDVKIEIIRKLPTSNTSTVVATKVIGTQTTHTDTVTVAGTYTYSIKTCTENNLCSQIVTSTVNVTAPVVTTTTEIKPATTTVPTVTTTTTSVVKDVPVSTTTTVVPVVKLCWDCNTTPTVTEPVVAPTKVVETVPVTPTSFYASQILQNGVAQNAIRLTWVDISTNELRFKIYRSSANASAELLIIDANTTTFEDKNLAPGIYTYYISACNLLGCSTDNAKSNAVTLIENKVIQPVEDPTLLLEISNAVGKTTPGNFINISQENGGLYAKSYTATALQDGTFKVKVPDGVYIVEGISPSKTVTIVNGRVTNVATKVVISTKTISGKVMLADGTFVANAEVAAYKKETSEWVTGITDAQGTYSLIVNAGTWDVVVRVKNGQTAEWVAPKIASVVSFSNEDKVETNALNFTVTPLNSTLSIVVRDESGALIPSIGVVIDTLALADSKITQTISRKIITEKTDGTSAITLRIPAGTYFVRTIVPESQSYVESTEMPISLTNNDTRTITLTLKKKVISSTVTLTGTAKFDDGKVTDAYVSLWSDEGASMSVKTDTNGVFSLNLAKDQTWHIRAIKDENGKSYASDEQTFRSTTASKNIELIFVKSESVALPTPVTTSKTVQEQVVVSVDNGARFTLPPNTVTSSGNINVTIKPTTEASSLASQTLVSTAYDITIKNSEGAKLTQLANDAEILLPYDENELKAKGVTLESVIPSYFDETLNTWVSVPNFTINTVKKVFVLHVNHLTRFALIAAADTVAPTSPTNIVTDAITPTDVRITWNNPSADFSHSKVYRSENPGTFGQVIAAEVFSNSFIDKTGALGKKIYYYTVRAVDAAGNESSNTNQIAVTTFNNSLATTNSPSLLLPPGQVASGEITRVLSLGSKGDDVLSLQKALKYDGFYATGPLTGYYGKLTENAVFRFQNYYKQELLIPNGYKIGTGVLGSISRKKINEIIVASGQ